MAAQIQEKRLSHSVCRTPEPEVDSDGDLDFEYRPSAEVAARKWPLSPRHSVTGHPSSIFRRACQQLSSRRFEKCVITQPAALSVVIASLFVRLHAEVGSDSFSRRWAVLGPPPTPINAPGCGSATNQSPRRLRTMVGDFIEFGGKGCVTRIHVAKTHALSFRALSRPTSVGYRQQGLPC